jgi:hypothetical protein
LPACEARIVHVPVVRPVTVLPLTVQTEVVSDEKDTARPDEAVAVNANGGVPNGLFTISPKVIVWLACVTAKL